MSDPRLEKVLAALVGDDHTEAEAFWKEGRSRRVEWRSSGELCTSSHEEGWAVRAGNSRSSFFVVGTGEPVADYPWPVGDGQGLRLPEGRAISGWTAADDLETPLMVETGARELLRSLAAALRREVPVSRVTRAIVEDGMSHSTLVSTRGVDVETAHRVGWLHLEVDAGGHDGPPMVVELAERCVANFSAESIARRVVDRLLVQQSGKSPDLDRADYLLAPAVGAALLAGLLPALVGPRAPARAAQLAGKRGSFARSSVSIVDDGRLRGGLMAAAADGEGVATRETVLVERGKYRRPLLTWRDGDEHGEPVGCARRASFRDLPVRAPSHLFWRPDETTSVGSLLNRVNRGYYLLAATTPARFDFDRDSFEIGVCGFVIRSGRATRPLGDARLCGVASSLLHGVQAVARDLCFFPLGAAMLGSPSMLVNGVEIRP